MKTSSKIQVAIPDKYCIARPDPVVVADPVVVGREVVTMDNKMFDEWMASVQEMDGIIKGQKKPTRRFEFPDPEVKAIRERMGVSQDRFAMILGVSKRTVENWEQGRRHPTGAARSLLKIVEADPQHALEALRA